MARVRKNVSKLDAQDETLLWYGRAVIAMRERPISNPLSWRYQAAVHEYDRANDPLGVSGDVLPSDDDQSTFWTQCQHGSWYFLPWHRMYLHHFEEIVGAAIEQLGGPADWALPYWNYSAGDPSSLLPPAFRNPQLDDGSPNGLYVAQRDPRANAGEPFANGRDVDVTRCLSQRAFQSPAFGGSSGFGGPLTKFEHQGGAVGSLEAVPHGSMHVAVGGDAGWMSAFNTAALDPIFWLHHANIDRLWEVWLRRQSSHTNPATQDWLQAVAFPFHDKTGNVVQMTPSQVLDTTAAPLLYSYDDTSDPLAAPVTGAVTAMAVAASQPELVGATDAPFDLETDVVHKAFSTHAPKVSARAALLASKPAQPRKVFLNIENLTASGRVPPVDVYVNVPSGEDPHKHEHLFAGRLPMFGLAEASRSTAKHAGSGLHYVLDVTELFAVISSAPGWDPKELRVSFVPTRKRSGSKVRVGRVSLYFE